MPDSYVTSANITDGKIQLSVRVDEFGPRQYVEVSGQATQTSGAFANFYDIQQVPAQPNVPADSSVPNDTDHYYIYVTGAPIPHQFRIDEPVTVVIRAARVWLTVLGASAPGGSQIDGGAIWRAKKVAQLAGGSW